MKCNIQSRLYYILLFNAFINEFMLKKNILPILYAILKAVN